MFQTIWAGQPKPNSTKQKKTMMSLLYLFCVWFSCFFVIILFLYFVCFLFISVFFKLKPYGLDSPTQIFMFKQKAG